MAYRLVSGLEADGSDSTEVILPISSLAITSGKLYCSDRTNSVVVLVTASVGSNITSLWVAAQTVASTATECAFIPVLPHQIWEADCANNTATNQLLKMHVAGNDNLINNTSTSSTAIGGVFEAIKMVGAAGDKKLHGRFSQALQVVS